jgi:sulfoxide reductase heme-binding subunit YedZ
MQGLKSMNAQVMTDSQEIKAHTVSKRFAHAGNWLAKNWYRLLVHIGALLPLIVLVWDFYNASMINPIQEATLRTGKTALVLLVLSLACTPINIVFGIKETLKVRRALGLYAFMYASIHFAIFVSLDYGFNPDLLLEAIFEKRFALAGFAAGLIMLPLAITSFKWFQKKMGKKWKRLHRLVYIAGLIAIVHYTWLVKSDIRVPLTYGAVVVLLLVLRISNVKKFAISLRQRVRRGIVNRRSLT